MKRIIEFIVKVGFPIVMCLLLWQFIVNQMHTLTLVVDNNSQALYDIQLVLERLDGTLAKSNIRFLEKGATGNNQKITQPEKKKKQ